MCYPKFPEECTSLLSKYLTPEVFDVLKDKRTSTGFTLNQAIRSGVEHPDSGIGVYAGDADSYPTFAPLMDPIIEEYHGFKPHSCHKINLKSNHFIPKILDPEGKYILSTRIRVGRNLKGYPLGPGISREQRLEVAQKVRQVLTVLPDDLSGMFYPLSEMEASIKRSLIKDHFLFKEGDRFLEAAGVNRHWPEGRGIFHNKDKNFLVWVNEEDQLRIISMEKGGDISSVYARLLKALRHLETTLEFEFDERLGYITSCPTNLGTAMRASVHIALPKLGERKKQFHRITKKHHLQIRGIHGEHSTSKEGIYDISNKRRLGVTEPQILHDLTEGVYALIHAEKQV